MKKIYTDHWYAPILGDLAEFETINDYSTIPDDCDVIALTFYEGAYHAHMDLIDTCTKKCKKLIVVETEPVSIGNDRFDLHAKRLSDRGVTVFSDTVLNTPIPNTGTAISWFVTNQNYYAPSSWPHWERWRSDMLMSVILEDWNRPRMFDCLLGASKFHRDIIHRHYNDSPKKDRFIFNYFKNDITQGIWPKTINFKNAPVTAAHVRYAGLQLPLSAILPFEIYNQSYYSIVAETTCDNAYSHFTEKVAKPMLARRPFVVFAGQYYLRNLRSLGFQTFGGVIDESYDSIEDIEQRFIRAWQQVEYLCDRDPRQVYDSLQDILDHNQRHFIETDWYQDLRNEIL